MKRSTLIVVIAVVAVILASAGFVLATKSTKKDSGSMSDMNMNTSTPKTDTSTTPSSTEATATSSVTIENYAFSPASITVKKGTKVTWTNKDSVQHDVMSDESGKGPSSELLAKGESYSYTFDTVGTFTYHCSPHPYMKGTVTVTE